MKRYDVFNGDADGLCALQQLRLDEPKDAILITGVKRDNKLLSRVGHASAGDIVVTSGDLVTVLDISLAQNIAALKRLLEAGVAVRYFDHHDAGEIPQHPLLEAHIDVSAGVCTSALVDSHLAGRQRPWAVVGAYGDGMVRLAENLAESLGMSVIERTLLRELGESLNYNAYGTSVSDLIYAPDELYRLLSPYRDPLRFIEAEPAAGRLKTARLEDMKSALAISPETRGRGWALYRLPDAAWSRRIVGVFANHLATTAPGTVHALLVATGDGSCTVSLRAPAAAKIGADELCRSFGGNGRRTAAGIDELSPAELERFIAALAATSTC